MILVDCHAHLDHERFSKDLDSVVQRSREKGVKAIITSGVNSATNRKVLEISEKYSDIVKASFGMYPIDALNVELENGSGFVRDVAPIDVDFELSWISKNKDKCVAVGEVGLDYHWVKDKNKEQKQVFEKVISLCEKIKKPIIVHSRKAEFDAVDMLESSRLKNVVMHCFMGKKSLVKRISDNGWSFSIPPIIVKLNQFSLMAEMVNMSQLLTETDCPYLSPYPGKRNEPAFVFETVKKIAEVKGMDPVEVSNAIFMNYQRMFL